MQKYFFIIVVFIYLIDFIIAQQLTNVTCPNYSYKCPNCKDDQFCSYPLSHGCEKSGVPICQAKKCHGVCRAKALPCPDDCPFSCEYHGTPCCPFIGQPTCKAPCQTLVECKITPCPEDCPDDCFYPNADYCCPKSGEPVCRSQMEDSKNKLLKRKETFGGYSTLETTHDDSGPSATQKEKLTICIEMIVPCPRECPNDCVYPTHLPCPQTHQPKCRSSVNPDQNFNELLKEFTDIVSENVNVMSPLKKLVKRKLL